MLKHAFCLFLSVTLASCASNMAKPIIVAPEQASQKELMSISKVSIVDARPSPSLAFINGKATPINKELISGLNNWLRKSVITSRLGSKEMTVSLLSYASYINQESFSFNMDSVIEWQVKLESNTSTWTKSYQTTMKEEGPLQADNSIIEKHLNKIAEQLLARTLSDPEFEKAVFN